MKILIVTATEIESSLLKKQISSFPFVHLIHTGIGMVNTAYALTKALAQHTYDLVLNVGIAGSYRSKINKGEVVYIEKEIFSELGAEDSEGCLLDLQAMKFVLFQKESMAYYNTLSNPHHLEQFFHYPVDSMVKGTSLTVNTVHGEVNSIRRVRERFDPDFESMEGGAVALVCQREGIPYFEFRSISNYVESRNTSNWNIPLACDNIQKFTIELIQNLKL